MLRVSKIGLILVLNYLVISRCALPKPKKAEKIDDKVIQRQRQDTLELCKLFKAQTDVQYSKAVKRSKRVKRENDVDVIADSNDLQRVEEIVEKMYDDLNENQPVKVTYKRRLNVIKQTTLPHRRFEFAPSTFDMVNDTSSTPPYPFLSYLNEWVGPYLGWAKQWIHGIVPYYIDPATYDFNFRMKIDDAMQFFEKITCIRLQKLLDKPTDKASLEKVEWIYITNPTGIYQCVHSNEVKPSKGVQMVILGYDCLSQGEIAHEVMHILGFSHEHTRPDRDAHISINWNNIKRGYQKYFLLRKDDPFADIPYDYASVLHYPSRAFSKNGKQTILPKIEFKLGQRTGLSQGDVEKVNLVFGPQCIQRNAQYLTKTCPIVLEEAPKRTEISHSEIMAYFQNRLWPKGVVKYKIRDKIEFSVDEVEKIESTMREISEVTCIKFKNLGKNDTAQTDASQSREEVLTSPDVINTSNEMNIVNSETDDGPETFRRKISRRHDESYDAKNNNNNDTSSATTTSAAILTFVRGTKPGCECPTPGKSNQNLVINADCFGSQKALLHLFLHVLGLDHQHNMYDRDSFLKIEWDVLTQELNNELTNKLPPEASVGFPYDYQSVMHLPWLSIKDGVQNIIFPVWTDGWSMGTTDGLSITDINKLKKLYCTKY